MAVVVIHAPSLSANAKKRIGEQVITALHNEDVPASSVVVLFKAEDADIYLDGGLLAEAHRAPSNPAPARTAAAPAPTPEPEPAPLLRLEPTSDFKTRARRTKNELTDLKAKLLKALQDKGGLSSFDAQKELGLQDCDWAPATLRRFFAELELEGVIKKEGQKRGTRYVLLGTLTKPHSLGAPKLVKKHGESEAE